MTTAEPAVRSEASPRVEEVAETMIVALADEVADGCLIHIGVSTFLGQMSAVLAKATRARNAELLGTSISGYLSEPFTVTLSAQECLGHQRSAPPTRITDVYTHVEQAKGIGFEPSVPVQIDQFGNVNFSAIGPYERPSVRLPGVSGIECVSVMLENKLVFYTTRHTPRTFVERVDFVTGPGNLGGPNGRREAGIMGDGGPGVIVSNLGVFDFDPETGRMRVRSLHPGVGLDEVEAKTGFELLGVDEDVPITRVPTVEERSLIRDKIDPFGIRKLEFLSAVERRAAVLEVLDAEDRSFLNGAWREAGWVRIV